jgi:photosystem II stability/assembly factor-like uncharacterized protein
MRAVRTFVASSRAGRLIGAAVAAAGLAAALLPALSQGNVTVSNSGWAWGNPTPQGRSLDAIAFAGGVGYAVGEGGSALSTSNAGQTWTGLTTGTVANLEKVQALSSSTVILSGGSGCVTRISEDGGQIFRRIFEVAESGCPEPVASFSFISAKVGFLLLKDGSVEETEDGGETFARKTGVPGTAASSGGGALTGTEIHFLSPTTGIAFVSAPGTGASSAYMTPDGGVSWTPVTLPAGARVTSLHFVDEKNAYAVGPETLLRSTDGGTTWTAEPIAAGQALTSIECATATECLLTVSNGNNLIETANGGETDTVKTASSSHLFAAGYASAKQIVAVGQSGTTVVSSDGGATFTPASADIGGEYLRLRLGPGGMLIAPGADGNMAISTDNGLAWHVVTTQTSAALTDVAFGTPTLGYALDVKGGLQRTANGGTSWQTLSSGTTQPIFAVAALGSKTALLFTTGGVYRALSGGAFQPVTGKAAHAPVGEYDLAGTAVFAYGERALIRSTNEGASWSSVKLPLAVPAHRVHGRKVRAKPGVSIRSISFTSSRDGFLLDGEGRIWKTVNGGASWREVLSAGTDEGIQLAFSSASEGFLSLGGFGNDNSNAYVLRTTNGGASWHPQEISAGRLGGLVAEGPMDAAALLVGERGEGRELFSTTTGGDIAGTAEALALSTPGRLYTKRKLKAAHDSVRVSGTLAGAQGGEQIVVSRRNLSGGPWQQKEVVAGANGGSFETTWHITKSSLFVAHWAGDNGHPGVGSRVLTVTVKAH